MDLKQLMGLIIDELYSGLTGGTAELPLPPNTFLSFLSPGIPLEESAFDWAIAGSFAGPTPLPLPYFSELVKKIQSGDPNDPNNQPMNLDLAVEGQDLAPKVGV